jgi:hypothetical protein
MLAGYDCWLLQDLALIANIRRMKNSDEPLAIQENRKDTDSGQNKQAQFLESIFKVIGRL